MWATPANATVTTAGSGTEYTSLPSGRLDADAYAFVDWLQAAGQSWWQMLPLGPPDRYGSPYKAKSAFAAWQGLLAQPRAPVRREEELDFRELVRGDAGGTVAHAVDGSDDAVSAAVDHAHAVGAAVGHVQPLLIGRQLHTHGL